MKLDSVILSLAAARNITSTKNKPQIIPKEESENSRKLWESAATAEEVSNQPMTDLSHCEVERKNYR